MRICIASTNLAKQLANMFMLRTSKPGRTRPQSKLEKARTGSQGPRKTKSAGTITTFRWVLPQYLVIRMLPRESPSEVRYLLKILELRETAGRNFSFRAVLGEPLTETERI